MEEIIKRLILGYIPNQVCNLKCEYCYITQLEAWDKSAKMEYSAKHIAKCLSKERLGGTALINLTGNGETLLQPEVPQIVECLLREGHYVEIVTNGTITNRLKEIIGIEPKLLNKLFFKISFHYKELKRLGIMEQFFRNVNAIQSSGASYSLELMAYDGIEGEIDDIIQICKKHAGAVCQSTIGRNQKEKATLLSSHTKDEFKRIWKPLKSPMMDFKLEMLDVKRKEFCYAGCWSLFVNMSTGEAQPCYNQPYNQNIFKNIKRPINFSPVGYGCTQPFCINAHAHLTWGLIPELETPIYEVMRNRKTESETEWLNKECKNFFSTRLYDANEQYPRTYKRFYAFTHPIREVVWILKDFDYNSRRLIKYIKRTAKWKKLKK